MKERLTKVKYPSVLSKLVFRILDISYKHKLSHIGSCIITLPIIFDVYSNKKPEDRVILSAGHSGLALYVVLEHFGIIPDAEVKLEQDGIHPVRGEGIDVSTGSLGQGVTIGVGMALANPNRDVYVISTDGEVAEGSFWESLYFGMQRPMNNLIVYVSDNGYSALRKTSYVEGALEGFDVKIIDTSVYMPKFSWLAELKAHYGVMNEQQYNEIKEYYRYYEFC